MTTNVLIISMDTHSNRVLLDKGQDLKNKEKFGFLRTLIKENENSLETVDRLLKGYTTERVRTLKHIGNFVDDNQENCYIFLVPLDFALLDDKKCSHIVDVKEIQRVAMADKLQKGVWETLTTQGMLKGIPKPKLTKASRPSF